MDIKVTINAPELATAINNLANAIANQQGEIKLSMTNVQPVAQVAAEHVPVKEKVNKAPEQPVAQVEPEKKEAPAVAPGPVKEEEATAPVVDEPKEEEAPAMTLEDVRAVLAPLMTGGKGQQIKELFKQFGADKLSAVGAEHYAELVKLAKEIK